MSWVTKAFTCRGTRASGPNALQVPTLKPSVTEQVRHKLLTPSPGTLPHPVTAVWAWGGGTARGAVTAALKFPVGVVEAVHHTHACPYTQHIHTTHTDTHRICVSGIPRTAVPMEWPDFKLYLPQVFPGKSQLHK